VTPDEREQNRRNFIADAIEVLSRSLDYRETLRSLAAIAVPRIADWCAVEILVGGVLRRLAFAHVNPAKIELLAEIERRFPRDMNAPSGTPQILRSGEAQLVHEITNESLEAQLSDPEFLALIRALGLRSYIGVPLRRGDKTIGVITLIMAESGRLYDDSDLALAETLSERASVAIDNASLFGELACAHEQTAAERDRLRQLVESAPIAIAILRGPDLVFEVANERFEQTFGGRRLRGLTQAALDPTGQSSQDLYRVMATGEGVSSRERAVHFDWDGTGTATTRYFDSTMAPMRDATGRVDGVMSFSLEVTEQVLARMRLEEARVQAELANRAKDEFLAMLGHELRNPLAPILTALELMELRGADVFQRERTVIARQVRHVVRLVDDLLDVSRITRGGVELHLEEIDLADIIGKAIEIASPLLEERGHQLITHISRRLDVRGDPVRLAQVIANLVTNAAKYTERGGTITLTAARDGERIAVHVHDTGAGIAPDVLPLVFETFYQARQSIDRARGGLGLGLAIVRSLVELHGGEVRATSEGVGRGSEFSVWLPALEISKGERPAAGRPSYGAQPVRSEKILVVDDNVDALNMLADVLEQRGFPTFRAHDAPSALALAANVHPDIALLDIGLPVMDGYELGRRLRETTGLERLRLVAVTGYGQPSDVAKSQAAGFSAHLVKPISIESVYSTIDRLSGRPHS